MKIRTPQNEAGWDLAPINPSTGKLSEDIIPEVSASVSVVTGNGLSGEGTSSSPLKVSLVNFSDSNANLTFSNLFRLVAPNIQVETNNLLNITGGSIILDNNVTVDCGSNGVISIGVNGDIILDGNGINKAHGLLKLGTRGIIDLLQKQECSYLSKSMADVQSFAPFATITSTDICYMHTWTGTAASVTLTIGYVNNSSVTTPFYRPRMMIINYDTERTILLGSTNISSGMTVGNKYAIPVLQCISNSAPTIPSFTFPMITIN